MSVTIADLLKEPSLSMAKVLAGEAGLYKVVSSISVLECMDVGMLGEGLFKNDEFYGSEIVITAFANAKEDIETQCNVVRRLYEGGEVGLILFYVGIFMPEVDRRLIDLCNELDFTLICMPEGEINYRYSEVITDVMTAIIQDQTKDTYFVGEMLERITALLPHQKTMDTVLRLLSDRLGTSFFLADGDFRLLNCAAWPRSGTLDFEVIKEHYVGKVEELREIPQRIDLSGVPYIAGMYEIRDTDNAAMYLFMIKSREYITGEATRQAVEIVRLFISIWGQGHGNVGMEELVKAILNDEPIKLRRLAEIFHINTKAIDQMIMVRSGQSDGGMLSEEMQQKIRKRAEEILKQHYEIRLYGTYQGDLLIFTGNENVRETSQTILQYLYEQIGGMQEDLILLSCPGLESTTDVRDSFLLCQEFVYQTRIIYPKSQILTLQKVQFASTCQEILSRGEAAVTRVLKPLQKLEGDQQKELRDTISTYLLDADMNIAKTAELLFVHKNTIKYRVANLNRIFHCQINKMPEAFGLYQAVAVSRLLQTLSHCPDGQGKREKILPKI